VLSNASLILNLGLMLKTDPTMGRFELGVLHVIA
jgi:hypothetical protein